MSNAAISRPSYGKLLRDPRWQRMRLEIMQRDGFACRDCKDETATLNVHHTYYAPHRVDPWDYPGCSLITLCESCHKGRHAGIGKRADMLYWCESVLSERTIEDIECVYKAIKAMLRSGEIGPKYCERCERMQPSAAFPHSCVRSSEASD